MNYEKGPEELAGRFRIGTPRPPAARYPRKAIKERLRKKLEKRMAEKAKEERE